MANHVSQDVLSEMFCETMKIRVAFCTLSRCVSISRYLSMCLFNLFYYGTHDIRPTWLTETSYRDDPCWQDEAGCIQVFNVHQSTIARTDKWLVTKPLRNSKISAEQIQHELRGRNTRMSARIVRTWLKTAGLKSCRPFKGIILTPE